MDSYIGAHKCLQNMRQALVRLIQCVLDLRILISILKVNCKKKSVEDVRLGTILQWQGSYELHAIHKMHSSKM